MKTATKLSRTELCDWQGEPVRLGALWKDDRILGDNDAR